MTKIIAYIDGRTVDICKVEGEFTTTYADNCKLIAYHELTKKDKVNINNPGYEGPMVEVINGINETVKMTAYPDEIWILNAGQNVNVTKDENFKW